MAGMTQGKECKTMLTENAEWTLKLNWMNFHLVMLSAENETKIQINL